MAIYQRIFQKICLIIQCFFVLCIKFYQIGISPYFACRCRFYPTCSQYALEAITVHGSTYGLWLIMKRLLKCHPACKGGYDAVPKKRKVK